VADSETRWGAVDRGGLSVGAHNADGVTRNWNFDDPSLSTFIWGSRSSNAILSVTEGGEAGALDLVSTTARNRRIFAWHETDLDRRV
jgi:hypothetical protein